MGSRSPKTPVTLTPSSRILRSELKRRACSLGVPEWAEMMRK